MAGMLKLAASTFDGIGSQQAAPAHTLANSARGEATMANLMQQVYEIDALLDEHDQGGRAA